MGHPEEVDLTGDVPRQTNEALSGHDTQPRPMGKKRASKKAKSETTTSTGGTSSSSQFGDVMTSEYRIKRESAQEVYRAAKGKDQTIQSWKGWNF